MRSIYSCLCRMLLPMTHQLSVHAHQLNGLQKEYNCCRIIKMPSCTMPNNPQCGYHCHSLWEPTYESWMGRFLNDEHSEEPNSYIRHCWYLWCLLSACFIPVQQSTSSCGVSSWHLHNYGLLRQLMNSFIHLFIICNGVFCWSVFLPSSNKCAPIAPTPAQNSDRWRKHQTWTLLRSPILGEGPHIGPTLRIFFNITVIFMNLRRYVELNNIYRIGGNFLLSFSLFFKNISSYFPKVKILHTNLTAAMLVS